MASNKTGISLLFSLTSTISPSFKEYEEIVTLFGTQDLRDGSVLRGESYFLPNVWRATVLPNAHVHKNASPKNREKEDTHCLLLRVLGESFEVIAAEIYWLNSTY